MRDTIKYFTYTVDGVKYTRAEGVGLPGNYSPNRTTRHLGKSDSAQARSTGRHNHG